MKNICLLIDEPQGDDPRVTWLLGSLSKNYDVHVVSSNRGKYSKRLNKGIFKSLPFLLKKLSPIPCIIVLCILILTLVLAPLFVIFFGFYKVLGKIFGQFRWFNLIKSLVKGFLSPFFVLNMFICHFNALFEMHSIKPYNIIVAVDLTTLLYGVYLKIKYGSKLIYDSHELWPYQLADSSSLYIKMISAYEKLLVSQVDHIFVVSEGIRAFFINNYSINKKKIDTLPNASPKYEGVDIDFERDGVITFQYIGGFAEGRGLEEIVEYWRDVPDQFQLCLRGRDSEFKSKLKLKCIKFNLNNVLFLETISPDEIIDFSAQFDVGIIPYRPVSLNNIHCCPNKLSEYLEAGNIILFNDLDNVKKILKKVGSSYSYKDKESFLEIVSLLASLSRQEINSKRFESRHFALNTYNWEYYEPLIVRVVDDLSFSV